MAAAASPAQRSEARGFLGETEAHLEEAEAPASAAQSSGSGAAPFLFEGQMSEVQIRIAAAVSPVQHCIPALDVQRDSANMVASMSVRMVWDTSLLRVRPTFRPENSVYAPFTQGGVVPPRPLGIQDVLMQLVQGGGAAAAGADADADTSHGDGNDAVVQLPEATPEDRERALEQLFEHFRDAFGGENCARTNVIKGLMGKHVMAGAESGHAADFGGISTAPNHDALWHLVCTT